MGIAKAHCHHFADHSPIVLPSTVGSSCACAFEGAIPSRDQSGEERVHNSVYKMLKYVVQSSRGFWFWKYRVRRSSGEQRKESYAVIRLASVTPPEGAFTSALPALCACSRGFSSILRRSESAKDEDAKISTGCGHSSRHRHESRHRVLYVSSGGALMIEDWVPMFHWTEATVFREFYSGWTCRKRLL